MNSVQVSTYSPLAGDGRYSIRSNAFVSSDLNYLNIVAVNRDKINTVPLQVSGTSSYTLNNARLLTATTNTSESINETTANTDISGNYIMSPMSVLILEYDNPILGDNEADIYNIAFQLYPNPTDAILNFSEAVKNAEIFNAYGQLVINKIESTDNISVGHLASGIYFIKTDKGVMKFVIKD